jgi:O-antigen/teichoic acid export membrane protein
MIKRNLIANFGAKFWTLFFSIVFLPYNIHFLGIEAYGLVGIYTTFFGILSLLLDMGLSTAASREMARMSGAKEHLGIKDFAKTMELIYWVTALLLAAIFICFSPLISNHWVNATSITHETVQKAVACMGFSIAALWPFAFYSGALTGLEKQVTLNVIICSFATVRSLGALAILAFVSSTIEAFFIWQACINFAQTLTAALALRRHLPKSVEPSKFKLSALKKIWRFTAGMSVVSVTILILSYLDKILLSKLLSLEAFGYYTFAYTLASGLTHLTGPIFSAFFPRFSQQAAHGNENELKNLYHLCSQLLACVILPVALCLILFSTEVLTVWGINALTIQESSKLIPFLAFGTAINALLTAPHALQLSHGWTRLALYQNVIAIIVLTFPLIWAVHTYGVIGAAYIWILLNIGYMFITIPFMHRRLLKFEMRSWYIKDCFFPAIATTVVVLLGRLALPYTLSRLQTFYCLAFIFSAAVAVTILSAPLIRRRLIFFLFPKKELEQ